MISTSDKIPATKTFDGKRYRFQYKSESFFEAKRVKEQCIKEGFLARMVYWAIGTTVMNVVYVRRK